MLITYEFATGEKVQVDIDSEFGDIILQFEKAEKLNNRAETRKHQSLDTTIYHSPGTEIDMLRQFEVNRLYEAIQKLSPEEQDLVHKIYLDPQTISQKEYARRFQMTLSIVEKNIAKTKAKLRKILN